MKIWIAELSLCNDGRGNWKKFFEVETDDKDYVICGFSYLEDKSGWNRKEIPTDYRIRNVAGAYIVEKGFEFKPHEIDCVLIKNTMEKILKEHLENEIKCYIDYYEAKMKGLLNHN